MSAAPGSLPWLLRNEAKVRWRELTGETRPVTLVIVGVAVFVFVHAMLWGIASSLGGLLTPPLPPEAVYIAALVVLVLFPFGVAAGINHSVVALFDRGDMDLLASSPVGSRTIFASRVLAVALGVFVGLGLFMLPIASLGVLMGLPQLLGAVPTLAVLAVVCACAGMLITLLLVRLLGPRRARTAAQLLAAFAGVLLFLVSQVPALLAGRWDVGDLVTNAARHFQPGGLFAADSLVWLPFRSLLLDPLGTLTALAGAGVVFWATVGLLHRAFAHGIALGEGRPVRRRVGERPVQFASRAPLGTLLAKEWKLILRDPFLISQVLLQVIYFLPAIYILFFTDTSVFAGLDLGPILAVVIVALSGVLTASIARITVVGEEAHDLLVSSPVGGRTVRRGKLLAAVVPVLLLAVPTSVGIFVLSPQAGVVAALLSVTGSLAVGALRSWNPVTAGRRDLFKNRSMGDPVMAVLEVLIPVMLAVATYQLAMGSPWRFGVLFVGLAIFAIGYLRARGRGTAFAL